MGIKKNFGYNLILTLCNYIFPMITFPYVSRVILADNIGVCGFVDGIINFFLQFAVLGIGSYGVREIARCGNDVEKRSKIFSNLIFINIILTTIAVVVLVALTLKVDRLQSYREFLGVGLIKIIFNAFLIEWFFQGIEQFKFITIRSVAVNFCYVICVLLFVKDGGDTIVYYFLTSVVVVFNALFNWITRRKYCKLSFRNLAPKPYLKPIFTFGYYRILTSMYTTFNVIFLGLVSGDTQAGYFTASTKLYTIIMAVFTAFTTVMIPRVSSMLQSKEYGKLQNVANDTFDILVFVSLPVIFFGMFFAPQIIELVAGAGYEGAITPFRITISLLLIIGMEQIVIQQFLMASTNISSILWLSTIGAVTGIVVNILFTPECGAIGSAIAWSLSEIVVLMFGVSMMKKYTSLKVNVAKILTSLVKCTPYLLLDIIIFIALPEYIEMWVALILNALLFVVLNLFVYKNEVVSRHFKPIMEKLCKTKMLR
ncbi:MAG: flippase [Bacteroidaceae bacterium]|nr:flippase [Bacteroidaceae bacterium]